MWVDIGQHPKAKANGEEDTSLVTMSGINEARDEQLEQTTRRINAPTQAIDKAVAWKKPAVIMADDISGIFSTEGHG